jgi:serine phosphatase RsbU (regulator of sigma subunit)/DNA-binding response OmpR family regulator
MIDEPATVLVVDDTEAQRYVLASWLRRAGHTVVEAATGHEALDGLTGIDLVVLDVRLPDLSGIEVCERIKADPLTAGIPVIQVSAAAVAVADRAHGLRHGADAYLAEPIEPEVFVATVTAALRYYRARRRAEQAASRLTALTRATLAINAAETFDRLARTAAVGAAETFEVTAGLIVIMPEGQLRRITVTPGQSPRQQGGPLELAEALAGRVLADGASHATATIQAQEWHQLFPDSLFGGDVCLTVSRIKPGRPPVAIIVAREGIVGQEEWQILRQLAQTVALAVEALRAYAEEHLVALTLQRSFLPSGLPDVPGVEMSTRYVPASDQAEVGGDFYELLAGDGHLLAAIGDVQGHSLRAAIVMGELRHALRAFADEGHPAPTIASLLNSVLQRYHPDIIATLCLVRLEVATGELQIVNCGHIPPLLIDEHQAVYKGQGGMLLGTPVDHPHVEHAVLPPGGVLLMITDGLVEERHVLLDDNLERLRNEAHQARDASMNAFADRILELFGPRGDDVALIGLRRS